MCWCLQHRLDTVEYTIQVLPLVTTGLNSVANLFERVEMVQMNYDLLLDGQIRQ